MVISRHATVAEAFGARKSMLCRQTVQLMLLSERGVLDRILLWDPRCGWALVFRSNRTVGTSAFDTFVAVLVKLGKVRE